MKLDLDINSVERSTLENYVDTSESTADEVKKLLRSGINQAKEGNRAGARQMLLKVTEAEPDNETAWLWLASISEYPEELLIFLQNVLKVNPDNQRALEWARQTKTLLSKTFVQRGINASHENQREFSKQCFLQAIVHDEQNEMAWLWLASTSDSQEEKVSHLQKVLQINPENETALSSLNAVKNQMSQALLKKANSAAIAGDRETSKQILEKVMKNTPSLDEAWILKAYLADDFYHKIEAYQKALEINSANEAAQAGLASLQALVQKSAKAPAFVAAPVFGEDAEENAEPDAEAVEMEAAAQVEEIEENILLEKAAADSPTEPNQAVSESFRESADGVFGDQHPQNEQFAQETAETENSDLSPTQAKELPADDSPTQELDEEFAQTADAVFHSYQETETRAEESDEPTREFHDEREFAEHQSSTVEAETNVANDFAQSYFETDETAGIERESVFAEEAQTEVSPVEEAQEFTGNGSNGHQSDYSSETVFESAPTNGSFADYQQSVFEYTPAEAAEVSLSAVDDRENIQQHILASQTSPAASVPAVQPENTYYSSGFASQTGALAETIKTDTPVQEVQQLLAEPQLQLALCPFCEAENETQNVVCHSCRGMLSLSDPEMLLSYQEADQKFLSAAIKRMEAEKSIQEFDAEKLTQLGLACLNARDLPKGFAYLQEASQINPNDVVLASKVNFLAIRLKEIEEHDNKAQEKPVQNRTILVVDDSPTVRKLISGKLEKCGHTVIPAIDGMDALAKINEVIPDLILLDITMPRLDGYQVCKLIRNNQVTREIPIIMISGKDGFFDKVRGRMAGSSGYITKPFGPDTLMKTIETYLG